MDGFEANNSGTIRVHCGVDFHNVPLKLIHYDNQLVNRSLPLKIIFSQNSLQALKHTEAHITKHLSHEHYGIFWNCDSTNTISELPLYT